MNGASAAAAATSVRAGPTSASWEASTPARTNSSGVSDSAIPSALNRATPWSNAFCTDRPKASAP